jgi:hypothetical protein
VLGVVDAAHPVLVAVREHDHVPVFRPVLVAVTDADPARPTGDDVKEDHPVGVRAKNPRRLPCR